jgi:hypothetical protein
MPDKATLTGLGIDQSKVARAGFGRGLCEISDGIIAAGSSLSTIAIHDLNENITGATLVLSSDIRKGIYVAL